MAMISTRLNSRQTPRLTGRPCLTPATRYRMTPWRTTCLSIPAGMMFLMKALRLRVLRVMVAMQGERDVGYLHGGVVGKHFRGLQVSFDERLAHLSLGNLLQAETLRHLCDEGLETYDLGTRSDYKRRWAEGGLETWTLLLRPRAVP